MGQILEELCLHKEALTAEKLESCEERHSHKLSTSHNESQIKPNWELIWWWIHVNTVSNLSAQINSFVTHFSSRVKKVDPKRFGIEAVRFISLVDVLTHEAPEHWCSGGILFRNSKQKHDSWKWHMESHDMDTTNVECIFCQHPEMQLDMATGPYWSSHQPSNVEMGPSD